MTASNFQKLATGQSASFKIQKQTPERGPEGRLLRCVTPFPVSRRPAFIIGRLAINFLGGSGRKAGVQVVNPARGAARNRVGILQMKRNLAFIAVAHRADGIFEIWRHVKIEIEADSALY